MIYFIPAWYAGEAWHEHEQYWHSRRAHTEFDDTVKQVQLFQRNKICPFQIMLLSYAPNFRHFLHRQGVYHAPYWSAFDAIQGIRRKKAVPLSYHSLKWPEGTEFVYSMFVVLAMCGGEKFARIEFGEDGNMIDVTMYKQGVEQRKNIYDDRGFASSSIVYHEGVPYYQDYLGEDGIWRIRHFLSTGRVRVNPRYGSFRLEAGGKAGEVFYQSLEYDDLSEILAEVAAAYAARSQEQDVFCAAVHSLHMPLLRQVLARRNLIFSMFEERNSFLLSAEAVDMLSDADQLICDSAQGREVLLAHGQNRLPPCTVITPFDIRPDFGISQQMTTQKILVPVDGLEPGMQSRLTLLLGNYMLKNPHAEVYWFTRKADFGLDRALLESTKDILTQAGLAWETNAQPLDMVSLQEEKRISEKSLCSRWFVEQCVDELSVSKCLRRQRLIVDFRNIRDVYLRVVTLSMGIPQILQRPSEFMVSGKNGVVLEDPRQLPQWLDFYLAELSNWNQAMVAAYEIGKRFDTATQLKRWKGVLDSFG